MQTKIECGAISIEQRDAGFEVNVNEEMDMDWLVQNWVWALFLDKGAVGVGQKS